jgi:hypothetical protein
MTRIYSYVLRYDDGAAPNPFWGVCTLTICKPAIRRTAAVGDWVIGTGSANATCNDGKQHDLSGSLVYAMRVTHILTLAEYDQICQKQHRGKIPDIENPDWRRRMGDCLYDYRSGTTPTIRPGVHNEGNRERDLSGVNALLSTHFYYFGELAVPLPTLLHPIIKKSQGHRKIEDEQLVQLFERWIAPFPRNIVAGDPQLKHEFDGPVNTEKLSGCGVCHTNEDREEQEDGVC